MPLARPFMCSAALIAAAVAAFPMPAAGGEGAAPPNVVLIITDDQGWGDLGFHGNSAIRTPRLDRLVSEGVRFERFYVSPVCAPTRSSLLTGRWNYRTGVLDTYIGRALMFPDEVTLAQVLRAAGYRTGIFGKWHLGDNFPLRPIDRGFDEALVHRGGGIGQPSDPPGGTSYFDPVLFRNGRPVKMRGYCSDIFADGAARFVEESRSRPFFLYLAFNAPHGPLEVPDGSVRPYRDADLSPSRLPKGGHPVSEPDAKLREQIARTYAMVTNIDDNVARLLAKLDELDLARRTIVIFLTDNGTDGPRWNGGLRDRKGSVFEGGIRVPCFLRWPGVVSAGRAVDRIAAHVDMVPTLLEACGVAPPAGVRLDGRSLWPLVLGRDVPWPDRTLFFQWHRGETVDMYRAFAARTQRWKLVQPLGVAPGPPPKDPKLLLFDMEKDPFEMEDVAAAHPEVVAELKAAYEAWFRDVTGERKFAAPRIAVGSDRADPVDLTRQDWLGPKAGWAPRDLGHWEVEVLRAGPYRVELRFAAPKGTAKGAGTAKARFEIGAMRLEREVPAGATSIVFESVRLPEGPGDLKATIEDAEGEYGAHQVTLARWR